MNRRTFFGRLAAALGVAAAGNKLVSADNDIRALLHSQTEPHLKLPTGIWRLLGFSRPGRIVHVSYERNPKPTIKVAASLGPQTFAFDPNRYGRIPEVASRHRFALAEFEMVEVNVAQRTVRYRQISGPELPRLRLAEAMEAIERQRTPIPLPTPDRAWWHA